MRAVRIILLAFLVAGCGLAGRPKDAGYKDKIVKVIDFELSPDEDKIAFSGLTPIGNTDIWVVDIDGSNLRKLTFKDRSPSNHIARFFKKHRWRNYYKIDMHSPQWTALGRVSFCQELTKYDMGMYTVGSIYWTINPDGTDKRPKTDEDEIVRRKPFNPIHSFELSDQSLKYNKKIFLKEGTLWSLDDGTTAPEKLIR